VCGFCGEVGLARSELCADVIEAETYVCESLELAQASSSTSCLQRLSRAGSDIVGHETDETPKDRRRERAISLLLSERTIDGVARKLNVTRRTVYRWLQDESFRADYYQARKNLLRAATARLTKDMLKASETLHKIVTSKGKPYQGPIVSAAVATIRLGLDSHIVEDLEERILKLEAQTKDAFTVE
jgi:AcrR family transcriptional regulator